MSSRVTRSASAAASPTKRPAPPTPPATPTKRARPSSASTTPRAAPFIKLEAADRSPYFAQPTPTSDEKLLHPPLCFDYEAARTHLIGVDDRWRPLMNRLPCKPFEGPTSTNEEFNPFRSLVVSIIGQQISWLAARSVTHKFTRVFFEKELPEKIAPPGQGEEGEGPFPTPTMVVEMENQVDRLRAAGLSGRKVEYVVGLAELFHAGTLSAPQLLSLSTEEVTKILVAVRGIGKWTAQMFEIFSLKRPDVMPHGDLGVQKNMLKWYSSDPLVVPTISPRKLEGIKQREGTPEGGVQAVEVMTPSGSSTTLGPYPTPSSPSTFEDPKVEPTSPMRSNAVGGTLVFPKTTSGLTPELCAARLIKKVNKGMYLTPLEMDELSEQWRPYRSVACWYLWSIADGAQ